MRVQRVADERWPEMDYRIPIFSVTFSDLVIKRWRVWVQIFDLGQNGGRTFIFELPFGQNLCCSFHSMTPAFIFNAEGRFLQWVCGAFGCFLFLRKVTNVFFSQGRWLAVWIFRLWAALAFIRWHSPGLRDGMFGHLTWPDFDPYQVEDIGRRWKSARSARLDSYVISGLSHTSTVVGRCLRNIATGFTLADSWNQSI